MQKNNNTIQYRIILKNSQKIKNFLQPYNKQLDKVHIKINGEILNN